MSDLFFGSGRRQRHPDNKKIYLVGSKLQVFNGNAHHTKSGLLQSDLVMNKRGRVVSRAKQEAAKTGNPEWIVAIKKAAAELREGGGKYGVAQIAELAKEYYVPNNRIRNTPRTPHGHRATPGGKHRLRTSSRSIRSSLHKMPSAHRKYPKRAQRKSRKSKK